MWGEGLECIYIRSHDILYVLYLALIYLYLVLNIYIYGHFPCTLCATDVAIDSNLVQLPVMLLKIVANTTYLMTLMLLKIVAITINFVHLYSMLLKIIAMTNN